MADDDGTSAVLPGSATPAPRTICFVSRVRPDRLDVYRERHAAVWPEMLEALRDTGWSDYHLYLSPDGLLVGHFTGASYEACQEAMAATAVNARWQAEMSEFFVNPGNPDEGFQLLPEVFHLEGQLAAAGLPTAALSTTTPPPAPTTTPAAAPSSSSSSPTLPPPGPAPAT